MKLHFRRKLYQMLESYHICFEHTFGELCEVRY